jgi:hypothetical protein
MSKLAESIRKAGKQEPAPIGFAAAAAKTTSPSVLVIVNAGNDSGKAAEALNKGADAVLLDLDAGKLRGAKLPDGAVVGVMAGNAGREEAAALREAGADFLVISEASRGDALLDEKLGFVITAPYDAEDNRLRLLGELSLDAVLVTAPETPVTVAGALALRRLAAFVRAPLLVETGAGAEAGLLHLLRESGAAGIVLPSSDIGKVGEVRERIASLPARGRKREEQRAEPLVPAQAMAGGHDDDDDYDDD